jgi:release factor glutamine methyltransferase
LSENVVVLQVGVVLRLAAARLDGAGCDTPRLDAELLLAEALDVPRERLVLDAREDVPADAYARYHGLIARRVAREPVAYILGRKPFRSIELAVDPRVLIPRPETELLVEVALSLPSGARVVDVGTGSGAVALALKEERPDLDVAGLDISEGAVAVAVANGARLELDVEFSCADLLGSERGFDAVLANLPYVVDGYPLAPEIVRYEPTDALFAGPEGLDVIRRLVPQLKDVGFVALEIGFDQASAVMALLRGAGLAGSTERDLAGHDRVVIGRR